MKQLPEPPHGGTDVETTEWCRSARCNCSKALRHFEAMVRRAGRLRYDRGWILEYVRAGVIGRSARVGHPRRAGLYQGKHLNALRTDTQPFRSSWPRGGEPRLQRSRDRVMDFRNRANFGPCRPTPRDEGRTPKRPSWTWRQAKPAPSWFRRQPESSAACPARGGP